MGAARYAADTRRAAHAAVAKSRSEGLDITLAGVGFRRTYAWHMTQSDWREAADHVLATVLVDGLDHHLNPDVIQFYASQPEDVDDGMSQALDEQRELQEKRDALARQGATVAVDVVTLRALFEHDLGFETIGEVARVGHKNIEVAMRDGSTGHLSILSSRGKILCGLHSRVEGAWRWCKDRLEVSANPGWGDDDALIGRDAAELAGDKLFEGLIVTSASRDGGGVVALQLDVPTRLFNAETGALLRQAA